MSRRATKEEPEETAPETGGIMGFMAGGWRLRSVRGRHRVPWLPSGFVRALRIAGRCADRHSCDLQPRIHGLTLQRQHTEHTLVHAPQRLIAHKPLQPFDTQGEFAQRERTLH